MYVDGGVAIKCFPEEHKYIDEEDQMYGNNATNIFISEKVLVFPKLNIRIGE